MVDILSVIRRLTVEDESESSAILGLCWLSQSFFSLSLSVSSMELYLQLAEFTLSGEGEKVIGGSEGA